jgi:hypothetical protein
MFGTPIGARIDWGNYGESETLKVWPTIPGKRKFGPGSTFGVPSVGASVLFFCLRKAIKHQAGLAPGRMFERNVAT